MSFACLTRGFSHIWVYIMILPLLLLVLIYIKLWELTSSPYISSKLIWNLFSKLIRYLTSIFYHLNNGQVSTFAWRRVLICYHLICLCSSYITRNCFFYGKKMLKSWVRAQGIQISVWISCIHKTKWFFSFFFY